MTLLQFLIRDLTDVEVAAIAKKKSSRIVPLWRTGSRPNTDALLKFSAHFKKTINELLQDKK